MTDILGCPRAERMHIPVEMVDIPVTLGGRYPTISYRFTKVCVQRKWQDCLWQFWIYCTFTFLDNNDGLYMSGMPTILHE